MDKFAFDELTNELEQEEQKVEVQEREMEDSEQRLQKIEGAIQALTEDNTIKSLLASNHQEAKAEHQAAQEKMEQTKETVYNIQAQMETVCQELAEGYDTLSTLETMGEDVSEAKEILEERQCLLEECHRRLEEIAQRLGISVDELDMETDDIIGGVSNTELAYLKENDFGAITEKALDYEDTEYLSEGRLIPAWVKDCKDTPHDEVIPIGDVIARYGGDYGKYFSDIATDFNSIQLPYYEEKYDRKYYKVVKPLPVVQSTVAWQKNFGIPMGAENTQQYVTDMGPKDLVKQGYLVEISEEEAWRLSPEGKTSIVNRRRTLEYDLHNPDLFKENPQGNYHYHDTSKGKVAYGVLTLKKATRDAKQQQTVGGASREIDDDGGHFIGSRFFGPAKKENLEAQNRNLNRGSYKIMENKWQQHLEAGDKVFVTVESYKSNDSKSDEWYRPDCFMGYYIVEHPDGTRDYESFSFQNESAQTQEKWNTEIEAIDGC